jgi:glycerophosphoryl diester phosphodiesterase
VVLLLACLVAGAGAAKSAAPLIIADGGSTCTLPIGTLEAFQTAIDEGANFIAITVASTKDGEFVVRPALTLGSSTNIADLREFNSIRRSVDLGNGRKSSGYFVSDLTLAQIKTLWATQSFLERDQSQDSRYRVATLAEALDLVHKANAGGKDVGVFVQILDPMYHLNAGLAGYTQVLAALLSAGFKDTFEQRVKIQSYDLKVLQEVADQMASLGLTSARSCLVWMIHCSRTRVTDAQLARFAKIGAAIAPEKELLESLTFAEECGKLISPPCWKTGRFCTGKLQTSIATDGAPESALLARAHAAGLAVYPFTFRNEGRFMAVDFASDLQTELNYFAGPRGMGVDGVYTDCTRTTSEWLALMAAEAVMRGLPSNAATQAAAAAGASATNAAASVAAAASKAASSVKAASVKTWAFGIVAGAAGLLLLLIGGLAFRSSRRRANQYKAWKEAGLSQSLDADLPVSTGAVWGLQKNTWSSQTSEMDEPAQASRASSIASRDSAGNKLKTYSGMLDSYAQSSRR